MRFKVTKLSSRSVADNDPPLTDFESTLLSFSLFLALLYDNHRTTTTTSTTSKPALPRLQTQECLRIKAAACM